MSRKIKGIKKTLKSAKNKIKKCPIKNIRNAFKTAKRRSMNAKFEKRNVQTVKIISKGFKKV